MKKKLSIFLAAILILSSWNNHPVSAAVRDQGDDIQEQSQTSKRLIDYANFHSEKNQKVTLLVELNEPSLLQQYITHSLKANSAESTTEGASDYVVLDVNGKIAVVQRGNV